MSAPANVPSTIGLPTSAPSDVRSIAAYLSQAVNALNQWIAQAANALNHASLVAGTVPSSGVAPGTYQGLTVNQGGQVTAAVNEHYISGNQAITLSGDATGSGTTSIPVTLDTVNSDVGTFQGITVNGKGLVTAAVNESYLTAPVPSSDVQGTTAGGAAPAGYIGEFQSSTTPFSSVVSLTTDISANISSLSLTAGDWDVSANIYFNQSTAGIITQADAAISLSSATLPSTSLGVAGFTQIGPSPSIGVNMMFSLGPLQVNVTGTTTVYLVGRAQFSTGTVGGYGTIQARRMR